ncbi:MULTISPECIES: nuclear transport factor 2 family protein [unclassified Rhizobacter]|uniref:nuclear transport factor 2 family protein n=1 Tax=unclassified Rhizobacter TaxID=2640088 RepID=UPI0006F50427|nr:MULTISPECIES: nuclear transport factor 2 family protein [unclassified Rhizobacter]KQU81590.1 hypothetical protein ASC88_01565 [Rhizobacter sp. Root29]KQW12080.1 hypothetical protein ASC98_20005 [Rhizobacter sp. Root1238]KRB02895.1 hypothetical protein ASE08_15090 [Rhizobacter sp. Root16D2]
MTMKTILGLMASLALCACSVMPASGGNASGGESAVAAAEKLRVAMVDPDQAVLTSLVADDLSYGHSSGRIDTKTSFIGDLMAGNSDFVSIDISDQTVKVVQDITLIRHTLVAKTNDRGAAGNVKLHVLQVWQRQGGAWKLVARQAVRPPA